jgi:hypothetical protein
VDKVLFLTPKMVRKRNGCFKLTLSSDLKDYFFIFMVLESEVDPVLLSKNCFFIFTRLLEFAELKYD